MLNKIEKSANREQIDILGLDIFRTKIVRVSIYREELYAIQIFYMDSGRFRLQADLSPPSKSISYAVNLPMSLDILFAS